MQRAGLGSIPAAIGWSFLCLVGFAFTGSMVRLTAQSPAAEFTGMWKATVGNGPMMQGMWLAQISKGSPNAASGSWSLLSDAGEIVLQGSWSARKIDQGWEGRWTARAGNGRALSGTWSASLGEFKGKTFQEMLALTMQQQIGGAWQSGRYQGNWWLEGSRPRRPK